METPPRPAVPALDTPAALLRHGAAIRRKGFLTRFYREAYAFFREAAASAPPGGRVEIGSGTGFARECVPGLRATDITPLPGLDLACSALSLPFPAESLGALFLLDAFHHLPDPAAFLAEAQRCLRPGGVVALLEPANTAWSRFVYQNFHHEPFDPGAAEWRPPPGGPMTGANGALPWIVFVRDRDRFAARFPRLRIERLEHDLPFAYLLSGGVSRPALLPGFAYPLVRAAERLLAPLAPRLGLFLRILLRRRH